VYFVGSYYRGLPQCTVQKNVKYSLFLTHFQHE